MKKILLSTGITLSLIITAAHFLRAGNRNLALIFLLLNFLLLCRKKLCTLTLSTALVISFITYLYTTISILTFRIENGLPFLRAGIILSAVTIFIGIITFLYSKNIKAS